MKPDDERRQRNKEIIARMRRGEDLKAFSAEQSWYPPRPVIKKDEKEIARLYDKEKRRKPLTSTFTIVK